MEKENDLWKRRKFRYKKYKTVKIGRWINKRIKRDIGTSIEIKR